MKRIVTTFCLAGIVTLFSLLPIVGLAPAAFAQSPAQSLCQGAGGTYSNGSCTGGTGLTVGGVLKAVANVLITLIGAVSVIMVIVGAFKYVLSNGNQSNISSAKDTILYALVGIVVASFAFAIVNFVIKKV